MESCMAEEECPVCKGTVQNPSEPSSCCRKVFCQSCWGQAIGRRRHCPYCRTPLPGHYTFTQRYVRIQSFSLPGLADRDDTFRTARPVGNNVQGLLNQLRDARMQIQEAEMSLFSNVSMANQATAAPASVATPPSSASDPQRRPTPRPRVRARVQTSVLVNTAAPIPPVVNPYIDVQGAPAAPIILPQPPLTGQAGPTPLIMPDSSSDELDEMAWRTEISLMENASRQTSSPSLRTFSCPYCQQDGLDDLDLRDHCNANHLSDTRSVVCPVCVSLPHGNPLYHSRDFIGHLNLRHCYYIQDVTNIHQSDDVNLQAAILMSLAKSN